MTKGNQETEQLIKRHGGRVFDQFPLIGAYRAELPAAALGRLGSDESINASTWMRRPPGTNTA